jgi:predicted N-acetyltransferase YhbS
MSGGITYRRGGVLDFDRMRELYRESTLGERRPIDDRAAFADMLRHANLVISAWDGELAVGIARTLTDFSYVAYLADLAVRASHQRQGIGTELMRRTREALSERALLVLLAAPKAVDYYPHLGFTRHPQAWTLKGGDALG